MLSEHAEVAPSTTTACVLLLRKSWIHLLASPSIPYTTATFLRVFDDQPCQKLSRSQAHIYLFEKHPACCLQCCLRILEVVFHKIFCSKNHVGDCKECCVGLHGTWFFATYDVFHKL